jgi:hypothetical protein
VLGISRQAYYQWCAVPISQRNWDDAHLIDAALEIHADDPADGYRFIADELARRGFAASENRVWRICSLQQIFSVHVRKKGRSRTAGPPMHDDLVRRDFTAAAPNTKWLTDITEHPTGEGKLYLCAVKDCYSNKIVGYSIGSHMRASLALAAFVAKALGERLHKVLAARGLACTRLAVRAVTEHGAEFVRVWRCAEPLTAQGIADRARWQCDSWLTRPLGDRPTAGLVRVVLEPEETVAGAALQLQEERRHNGAQTGR